MHARLRGPRVPEGSVVERNGDRSSPLVKHESCALSLSLKSRSSLGFPLCEANRPRVLEEIAEAVQRK